MSEKSTGPLSPFVYWAQTDSVVTLKVDLKNVQVNFRDGSSDIFVLKRGAIFQEPQVRLKEETVEFSSNGVGAQGLRRYAFAIHLHSAIDPEVHNLIFSEKFSHNLLKKCRSYIYDFVKRK